MDIEILPIPLQPRACSHFPCWAARCGLTRVVVTANPCCFDGYNLKYEGDEEIVLEMLATQALFHSFDFREISKTIFYYHWPSRGGQSPAKGKNHDQAE